MFQGNDAMDATHSEIARVAEQINEQKSLTWGAIHKGDWKGVAVSAAQVVSLEKKYDRLQARWARLSTERAKKS